MENVKPFSDEKIKAIFMKNDDITRIVSSRLSLNQRVDFFRKRVLVVVGSGLGRAGVGAWWQRFALGRGPKKRHREGGALEAKVVGEQLLTVA
ncbi:hypothetical protein IEN85_12925 [Pelagicoccus sp. NFK12]|uniref:Uncharacterized protein n=1 Tax=Pelagicoccus enzymogenes TaxID=2773457 RepID=A0A927FAU6_9BACT|nr:hypothetical protein [Pelagicoccus enzymogenes]MBD5780396.1 hypothetical protein [Pelagicoccus enzymogenes]